MQVQWSPAPCCTNSNHKSKMEQLEIEGENFKGGMVWLIINNSWSVVLSKWLVLFYFINVCVQEKSDKRKLYIRNRSAVFWGEAVRGGVTSLHPIPFWTKININTISSPPLVWIDDPKFIQTLNKSQPDDKKIITIIQISYTVPVLNHDRHNIPLFLYIIPHYSLFYLYGVLLSI